jgi:hypothetical protein
MEKPEKPEKPINPNITSSNDSSYNPDTDSNYSESVSSDYVIDAYDNFDSEGENLPELTLGRQETCEISRDYRFEVLGTEQLRDIFLRKISQISSKFDYAQIDQSVFFEKLRQNNFLVEESFDKVEDEILGLMEERKVEAVGEEWKKCGLCMEEFGKDGQKHFGCGHAFCGECMGEYLKFKFEEGPSAIHAKCPWDGCNFRVSLQAVEDCCDKGQVKL